MINGWLQYQTLASRLFAKSGYYQSGGANGFRDQLQDSLSAKYIDTEILKNQIIKSASHQFLEGDVLHWWHEQNQKGIRTKISDDLLWLVYCVCEYIKFSGDSSILEIEVPYLEAKELGEFDERYDVFKKSNITEKIYNHCIRAIEKKIDFGENGLPKIGTGDWNDGLNKIGCKGKGESVWLGFFMYAVLERFIAICKEKNDLQNVEKYKKVNEELKKVLNNIAWDGRWYKRAFTDDGEILGSMENEECKIDRDFAKLGCDFRCR